MSIMKPKRDVGIVGYGAYVPRFRIRAEEIARVWGGAEEGLPIEEKAVPGLDEDTVTMSIEAAAEYIVGGKSYDDVDTAYGTYAALDATTYGALKISGSTPLPGVFDTAHVVKTLTGVAGTGTLTTNDFGEDGRLTLVSRVRPRYILKPTSATLLSWHRAEPAEGL